MPGLRPGVKLDTENRSAPEPGAICSAWRIMTMVKGNIPRRQLALGATLALTAILLLPASAPSSSVAPSVQVSAAWYLEGGVSRIHQWVTLENHGTELLCARMVACGSNLLLWVVDQKGNRIGYGTSCGTERGSPNASPADIGILFPTRSRTIPFSAIAKDYRQDDVAINLSPANTYIGSGSVTIYKCRDLLDSCSGGQCRFAVPSTTVEFKNIRIEYKGHRTCGRLY